MQGLRTRLLQHLDFGTIFYSLSRPFYSEINQAIDGESKTIKILEIVAGL
jgi:hypothetical protein